MWDNLSNFAALDKNHKQKHIMANAQGQMNEETFNQSEAFFVKYKKTIITAVAAVIIIAVGAILYNNYYAKPHADEASTILAKGQAYFYSEEYEMALNGDKAGFYGLLALASDYSGTDAANLANLYAGLCYANTGKWAEAVTYIEKYSPSDDQMISPAAVNALGDAYSHTGDMDKAVECYRKAAKMADAKGVDGVNISLSPIFLIKAGEILESQGKKEDALEIYKNIKAKYAGSPIWQDIDKYIERASL